VVKVTRRLLLQAGGVARRCPTGRGAVVSGFVQFRDKKPTPLRWRAGVPIPRALPLLMIRALTLGVLPTGESRLIRLPLFPKMLRVSPSQPQRPPPRAARALPLVMLAVARSNRRSPIQRRWCVRWLRPSGSCAPTWQRCVT